MAFAVFVMIGIFAGIFTGRVIADRMFGLLTDTLVGVAGALVGGYLFDAFGISRYGLGGEVIMSLLGAAVFLFVGSLFAGIPKVTTHGRP